MHVACAEPHILEINIELRTIVGWQISVKDRMNDSPTSSVKSVDAATVKEWLDQDKIVLVDVRETSEYDQEHIPGSMLLPMSKFDAEIFRDNVDPYWLPFMLSPNWYGNAHFHVVLRKTSRRGR